MTPTRNEEKFLPGLAESILNQTSPPILWLIVNDMSEDKTKSIINKLESKNNWIMSLNINKREEKSYYHRYACITRKGFDYAINTCKKRNQDYKYLGVVDADIIFGKTYYERLIEEFEKDPILGIASGIVCEPGLQKDLTLLQKTPRGAALFFRKECYESIGGFPQTPSPDSISIMKARKRGWNVKVIPQLTVSLIRDTYSRGSRLEAGKEKYFINYHPINAFLTGLYLIVQKSPYIGFSFLYGYFKDFFQKKEKIKDEEIRQYYWGSFYRLLRRTLNLFLIKKRIVIS